MSLPLQVKLRRCPRKYRRPGDELHRRHLWQLRFDEPPVCRHCQQPLLVLRRTLPADFGSGFAAVPWFSGPRGKLEIAPGLWTPVPGVAQAHVLCVAFRRRLEGKEAAEVPPRDLSVFTVTTARQLLAVSLSSSDVSLTQLAPDDTGWKLFQWAAGQLP